MADTPAPMTDAEIARITVLATDFDDGDFTGKPILSLIARVELERARVVKLEAVRDAAAELIKQWELFTGPERNGWGNQEQAYYDLAKHAHNKWKALSDALAAGLNPGPDAPRG